MVNFRLNRWDALREHPLMMSDVFWVFLTPHPPQSDFVRFQLFFSKKFAENKITYEKEFANFVSENIRIMGCPIFAKLPTLTSLINVESTLTDFEKFHLPQKKIYPPQN